jgi:hypothetical protein
MYCKNCNTPLNDNEKFCPSCGTKTENDEQVRPDVPGNSEQQQNGGNTHYPQGQNYPYGSNYPQEPNNPPPPVYDGGKRNNNVFITALLSGIIGIVLSIISYYIFWWLSIVSVVLGGSGIFYSIKTKSNGNALWVLCLIFNIIAIIIGIAFAVLGIIGLSIIGSVL